MNKQPLAVVLVSGGMDSCVVTAIANQSNELALLHANYGQRTEERELRAFQEIALHYKARHTLTTPLDHFKSIGGSSLTDRQIAVSPAMLNRKDIPTSYVPFRNANMLCIAVSWAEVIGATSIYIGAVQEDSSGYPDCRVEFFDAFKTVIRAGTRPGTRIELKTPIIHLTKAEIVQQGILLRAPLHLTWSCYSSQDVACGQCDSCALRLRGFRIAGVEDPIPYAAGSDQTTGNGKQTVATQG